MHEMAMVKDMVAILDREVADPEVGDVKTVYLEVGEYRYIVSEIMDSCFRAYPKSDKLKNASLKIDVVPGRDLVIKGVEW